MVYLSWYRKLRPQNFEEVVGQVHVTQTLQNALKKKRLSHAYLFAGPRGTGKTTVARILAKALNCEKGPTPSPCNKCSFCEGITKGSLMDVLEIDAASNRGIDEIRDLREKIHFAPGISRAKVYIVDEVHMLTTEAFNALLKTLEEPPSHAFFILATTEPHKVPLTIASRCQRFDFRPLGFSETKEYLEKIVQQEKVKVAPEALETLVKFAQGSIRDALGILEQLSSYAEKEITRQDIESLLGMVPQETLLEFSKLLSEKNIFKILLFVEKLKEEGKDLRQFAKSLIEHFRELLLREGDSPFSPKDLLRFIEVLSQVYLDLRFEPQESFLLEAAFIKLIRPSEVREELSPAKKSEETEAVTQPATSQQQPASAPSPARGGLGRVGDSKQQPAASKETPLKKKEGQEEGEEKAQVSDGEDLARVKRGWPVILEGVKLKKISTYALLLECQPLAINKNNLILQFKPGAVFHQEELEKPQNLKVVEEEIYSFLGRKLKLNLAVAEAPGEATPPSPGQASGQDSGAEVSKVLPSQEEKAFSGEANKFDPTQIIEKVKESFNAEIVEEKKENLEE